MQAGGVKARGSGRGRSGGWISKVQQSRMARGWKGDEGEKGLGRQGLWLGLDSRTGAAGGGWGMKWRKEEKRGDGRRSRVAGWLTLRLPPLGSRHAGPKTNLNLFY